MYTIAESYFYCSSSFVPHVYFSFLCRAVSWVVFIFFLWDSYTVFNEEKNYNSKREDLEEEDQGEDERNVIL